MSKTDREEALASLREVIRPGQTIYVILRKRAASGMSRTMDFLTLGPEGPRTLAYRMAKLGLGTWREEDSGIRVGGCGMDMGFHCVYELGRMLWPDGVACLGPKCQSNDHSNGLKRPVDKTAARRAPKHRDSGYALTSRWL